MAKKAYDIPIDYRNEVSWSGDKTTEDLPLAGSVVEKYIKDNFKHKAGTFIQMVHKVNVLFLLTKMPIIDG